MGQSSSLEGSPRQATPEQVSHELALRFATKCFSPLELTHLKDNFRSLADQQDGLKYWREQTLQNFLCVPDALGAGPVLYQMASYLGGFPCASQLSPSILTLEALVKVVVIMTERYNRILKRGRKDRIKLLFRSLAVFDRRMSQAPQPESEKPTLQDLVTEQKPDDMVEEDAALKEVTSHAAGFAIDEPADDDEEEDDDELALAALDSLDAIEVFKVDHKHERKINQAQIPVHNFKRLVMLLLAIAPLESQDNLAKYGESLSQDRLKQLEVEADSIIAAFHPSDNGGIGYRNFTKAVSSSLPYLFEPLNALFEHFLFSKNIDLSKKRGSVSTPTDDTISSSPIVLNSTNNEAFLTDSMLAHMSTFLSTSSMTTNLFHARTRFNSLYSTSNDGTSLTSFHRQVLSWQAPTVLLLSGTFDSRSITIGAYIPTPWSKAAQNPSDSPFESPAIFILHPRHAYFPANPYHRPGSVSHSSSTAPFTYFSAKSNPAISIGGIVPPASRTHVSNPVPGPISLQIDSDLSTATFFYNPDEGSGAFIPDPSLPRQSPSSNPASPTTSTTPPKQSSSSASSSSSHFHLPTKTPIDISSLSVYGLSTPDPENAGDDELTKQRKRLAWEEAEAERRRGVSFGGDKEGARALLEMAGIVGGSNRSGGSMG